MIWLIFVECQWKKGQILSEIGRFSIVTQPILFRSHRWDREVNERLELHNLCTDHVMMRSLLKYLIGGNGVMLKCRVFGGKTGPFPMGPVIRVVRSVAMVQIRVELEPEPTWEFGPVAYTNGVHPGLRWLVGRGAGLSVLIWEQPYGCLSLAVLDQYYIVSIVSEGQGAEGTTHIRMYKFKGLCCMLDWHFNEPLLVLTLDADSAHRVIVCISANQRFNGGRVHMS